MKPVDSNTNLNRNIPIQLKFNEEEHARLKRDADDARTTVAKLIRSLVDDYLGRDGHPIRIKGQTIFLSAFELKDLQSQLKGRNPKGISK